MRNKIYVGNLSYNLDESGVRTAFSEFGEITDLAFPKDRVTGKPRGFAFITFANATSAESSLKLDGYELGGRKIVVKFALERGASSDRNNSSNNRRRNDDRRGDDRRGDNDSRW